MPVLPDSYPNTRLWIHKNWYTTHHCQQCASVFSLLNPHKTSATFAAADLLIEGVLPQELLQKSQLNNKLFMALKKVRAIATPNQSVANTTVSQRYRRWRCILYRLGTSSLSRSGKGEA